ncbi:hypothetical protein Sjap_015176 [Stephania japonica]|uniref:Uncharacterized protein n=1 Tax=Stephania japonica TaxID=461633 RepID=A0AAP0NS91_9MAGN
MVIMHATFIEIKIHVSYARSLQAMEVCFEDGETRCLDLSTSWLSPTDRNSLRNTSHSIFY